MLRLSDGQAPAWLWSVSGATYEMRPLSLSTFALAEANGCGLDDLLHGSDDSRFRAWVALYALLSRRQFDEVLPEVTQNEAAFTAFVQHVQQSFVGDGDHEEPEPTYNHRRAKDPREKIATPDGRTMKSDDSTDGSGATGTDYRLLFDLSRYARIALSDIYQMTFRGLGELTTYLKERPPVPSSPFGMGDTL